MTIGYDSEARLRAIALNSVREAMLVYNRWDKPFTDDDAARVENIYQILHLAAERMEYEHAPLAATHEAAVTSSVRKISDILANLPPLDAPEDKLDETPAIKVTLPKPTAKAVSA